MLPLIQKLFKIVLVLYYLGAFSTFVNEFYIVFVLTGDFGDDRKYHEFHEFSSKWFKEGFHTETEIKGVFKGSACKPPVNLNKYYSEAIYLLMYYLYCLNNN